MSLLSYFLPEVREHIFSFLQKVLLGSPVLSAFLLNLV